MITLSDLRATLPESGPWQAAENSVTRLPWESQLARLGVPLGETPEDEAQAYTASGAALPRRIDYRNLGGRNYVSPVQDQGNCGSCVAFGSLAAVEATYARAVDQSPASLDLSEAHLFFCIAENEGRSCENGWWPSRAYANLQSSGVVDEVCYRYVLPSDHCAGLCKDAAQRKTRISSATKLSTANQIKDWLASKGAVSACFEVYEDFFYYSSGVYEHTHGALVGGHCVSIIGYDDDQSCWICKNSWKDTWGDHGYFRIRYGQCRIEAWETHGVSGVVVP